MSVESYFSKKLKFRNENYSLPPVEVFFSSANNQNHEGLQIIKSILNHVKSKLNDYQIEEWSYHTRQRNPAQHIPVHLKNVIRCEFVTQAFAKFFEVLNSFQMVNNFEEKTFQSVHLCEAPGAFIVALNHYMKLHYPDVEFRWRASTLNPYFEGNSINNAILDDRLISHTLQNWIFGEDYDGDILQENNIRSLIEYCKSLRVNLATGDGSIDCLHQPEDQEEFVSKLHLAEIIVSLAVLVDNGSMLIKMFTFFETSSVGLLYVLNCCFKELHIFKPATSKEGNSEVYVIGIGYKKHLISDELIEEMIKNFKDNSKVLLPLEVIPKSFQEQVVEIARVFMNLQVSVIEGNIRTFKKYDKQEIDRIKFLKESLVKEYCKKYKVESIRDDQKMLQGLQINNNINLNVRVHSGSHSDRMTFFSLSRADQFVVFFDRLKQFFDSIFESDLNSSCVVQKLNNHEMNVESFVKLIYGRPITKVVSSKFILVTLVKYLIELTSFLSSGPRDSGAKFNAKGNHLTIEMDYYRTASSYSAYEKDVTIKILNFLIESDSTSFVISGFPLFTQFSVGLIMYLSLFVFEEVHLRRSSGTINFKSLRTNGKANLKYLIESTTTRKNQLPQKVILGICDTKLLFSLSHEFYKSVIDYNNHLCLKFCSFYLNINNNLQ